MTTNPLSQIGPVTTTEVKAAPTLQELMTEFFATVSSNKNLGESKKWNGLYWETSAAPDSRVRLESIEHFNARGMHMVYGRGDHFGQRQPVFHMDIWQTRDRR